MIRTHTLVDDFEYVSRLDDAVDAPVPPVDPEDKDAAKAHEAALAAFEHKWSLYQDGGGPCPLKGDAQPTYLRLRHLTPSESACVFELGSNEGGTAPLVARFALVGARGLEVEGKPYEVKFETLRHGGAKFRVASTKSMDVFPPALQFELGHVVMARMRLRPS